MKRCPRCGQYVDDYADYCNHCGYNFRNGTGTPPPVNNYPSDNAFDACGPEGKSRGVAALLAIFLGGLGIQYFYLDKPMAGILSIVFSIISCGLWATVALIQGIVMLCMTNVAFRTKYVTTTSSFPLF